MYAKEEREIMKGPVAYITKKCQEEDMLVSRLPIAVTGCRGKSFQAGRSSWGSSVSEASIHGYLTSLPPALRRVRKTVAHWDFMCFHVCALAVQAVCLFQSELLLLFLCVPVCVCVYLPACGYVHKSAVAHGGQKRASDALKLGSQAVDPRYGC